MVIGVPGTELLGVTARLAYVKGMVKAGAVVPVNGIAGTPGKSVGATRLKGVTVGVSALLLGTAMAVESMIDAAITLVEKEAKPFRNRNFVIVNLS
jgi:hypothetical protein